LWEKVFNQRIIFYIASALFLVIGLCYFTASMSRAYVGVGIEKNGEHWLATYSSNYGEGYLAGIRSGDRILKINGADPGAYPLVQKWGEMEGAREIEYLKTGENVSQTALINPEPGLPTLLSDMPQFVLGLVFWFLGFFTWLKRPFLKQARLLFWFSWALALALVLASPSSRCLPLARELEYITFSLAPLLLIAFVSVFPVKSSSKINRYALWACLSIFTIAFILVILHAAGIFTNISLLRKIILLNMVLGVLVTLGNLIKLVRLSRDEPGKNEANIILLGMAVGFLPGVLLTALPIIFNMERVVFAQLSSLTVAAIPISLYYVIVNKYLPDSRRLYELIISYFLAAVFVSLVLAVVLDFFKIITAVCLDLYIGLLLGSLLFIFCLQLARIGIMRLFRVFFKERQGFGQRMAALSTQLTAISSVGQILEKTAETMAIDGIFMILEDERTGSLQRAVGRFEQNTKEQVLLEKYFRDSSKADPEASLGARILPEELPAVVYVPLVSQGLNCGIFFGQRASRIKYDQSDLPFLTLLAAQMVRQLQMSLTIADLTKEISFLAKNSDNSQQRNHELQSLHEAFFRHSERKSKQLTEQICSGPLQLGLEISRWLKYLESGADKQKSRQIIIQLRQWAEDLKYELGLVIDKAHPVLLSDLGLIPAVQNFCQDMMLKELVFISLEIAGIKRDQRFKEDVEIAAYRFLQEGIMNSLRHSGSSKQTVRLELSESKLRLTVSDYGRGFDTSQLDNWVLNGSHFGLVLMKERLERLGGCLQINSQVGSGTVLQAEIPVA